MLRERYTKEYVANVDEESMGFTLFSECHSGDEGKLKFVKKNLECEIEAILEDIRIHCDTMHVLGKEGEEMFRKQFHDLLEGKRNDWAVKKIDVRPGSLVVDMVVPRLDSGWFSPLKENHYDLWLGIIEECKRWDNDIITLSIRPFHRESVTLKFSKRCKNGVTKYYQFDVRAEFRGDLRHEDTSLTVTTEQSEEKSVYRFDWMDSNRQKMIADITEIREF